MDDGIVIISLILTYKNKQPKNNSIFLAVFLYLINTAKNS